MLNIDRPQLGQWIHILLKANKTRPEWAVLQPEYEQRIHFILSRSITDLYDKVSMTFVDAMSPMLTRDQYPNITGATLNIESAVSLLARISHNADHTLLITGERRVIIGMLVSIYPLFYVTNYPSGPTIDEHQQLITAHNAMLEFIHLGLSVTPFGVLDIEGEIIDGTGQSQTL